MTQAWDDPARFLLVFTQRGGSTYLAHCLDSHPDIGCERGEPLCRQHIWARTFPKALPEQLLDVALRRPGYRVTVARVTHRAVWDVPIAYLQSLDGIMHLHRENFVRIIVSAMINTQGWRMTHTYERLPLQKFYIDPDKLVSECHRYLGTVRRTRKWLGRKMGVPFLKVGYEGIVGGEGTEASGIPEPTGRRLCEFLGVEYRPLTCDLKRTNPEPLHKLVKNWREVREALLDTPFEKWIIS